MYILELELTTGCLSDVTGVVQSGLAVPCFGPHLILQVMVMIVVVKMV